MMFISLCVAYRLRLTSSSHATAVTMSTWSKHCQRLLVSRVSSPSVLDYSTGTPHSCLATLCQRHICSAVFPKHKTKVKKHFWGCHTPRIAFSKNQAILNCENNVHQPFTPTRSEQKFRPRISLASFVNKAFGCSVLTRKSWVWSWPWWSNIGGSLVIFV